MQIAAELHIVVKEARQASLVHLAPHTPLNLLRDAVAYIKKIEDSSGPVLNLLDVCHRGFGQVGEGVRGQVHQAGLPCLLHHFVELSTYLQPSV
ncbi:hypothetical protein ABBQ38_013342 [Trebouxia sp. C0009 RCD-2024]